MISGDVPTVSERFSLLKNGGEKSSWNIAAWASSPNENQGFLHIDFQIL
jgi:hypothetical protein